LIRQFEAGNDDEDYDLEDHSQDKFYREFKKKEEDYLFEAHTDSADAPVRNNFRKEKPPQNSSWRNDTRGNNNPPKESIN